MYVYRAEPGDDERQYDYANPEADEPINRQRRIQEATFQRNDEEGALETVQNPYYGVDDTAMETDGQVQAIKVVENTYYGVDDINMSKGKYVDNSHWYVCDTSKQ